MQESAYGLRSSLHRIFYLPDILPIIILLSEKNQLTCLPVYVKKTIPLTLQKGMIMYQFQCFGKSVCKRPVILLLLLTLLTAGCSKVAYNYSPYQKGYVWEGNMKDGRSLYLIRENDSDPMSGHCFIYDENAVVDFIPFQADVYGKTQIQTDSQTYISRIRPAKKGHSLKLYLPPIPEYGIRRQQVDMKYHDLTEQHFICTERYSEQRFDSIVVQKDIMYGKAPGFYTSQPIDSIPHGDNRAYLRLIWNDVKQAYTERKEVPLLMDIYQPYDPSGSPKPVFMFIHGGGFFFGDKENRLQQGLTEDLVKRGYTVVSINYRLGSTIYGVRSVEKLIYSGVQDARAALRYLTHHSAELGIDPHQIYIGGSSAGAITSLYTAFMDNDENFQSTERRRIQKELGDINTSGNDLKDIYSVAGVVSMWGAVVDLDIIDWRNADIPVVFFHGTADNIVPIDSGLPFQHKVDIQAYNRLSENWQLYGSQSIYNHMQALGMPAKLYIFEGYGHEPQINPDNTVNENMETIKRGMENFMYKSSHNENRNFNITGPKTIYPDSPACIYTLQNGAGNKIKWNIEGGMQIERISSSVKVVWDGKETEGIITACVTDDSGESEQIEMRVKILAEKE